jgi:hypothetical protein
MVDKTLSNRKPEAYAPCGGLIEDDGFVTVYPDLNKQHRSEAEAEENLPTP